MIVVQVESLLISMQNVQESLIDIYLPKQVLESLNNENGFI